MVERPVPGASLPEESPIRIAFVTPRFPYPPDKGDKVRAYYEIRGLAGRHEVDLFSLADAPVAPGDHAHVADLCRRVEVVHIAASAKLRNLAGGIFGREPLQVAFYRSAAFARLLRTALVDGSYDIVHVSTARMAPYAQGVAAPVVVDLIDAQAIGLRTRGGRASAAMKLAYALEIRRIEAYEREVAARSAIAIAAARADQLVLGPDVRVLRNAVDLVRFGFGRDGRAPRRLVMTGNMGYQPNVDGAKWFAREVWPLLRGRYPDLEWALVGARPAPFISALSRRDGIDVVGPVDDLGAHLRSATVAVAPILCGAGIQNKVLEAFATGTPLVATSSANAGVDAVPNEHLLIGDEPAPFADAITRLLEDGALRDRLAGAARAFVEATFTWEGHVAALEALYEEAVAARETTPAGTVDVR